MFKQNIPNTIIQISNWCSKNEYKKISDLYDFLEIDREIRINSALIIRQFEEKISAGIIHRINRDDIPEDIHLKLKYTNFEKYLNESTKSKNPQNTYKLKEEARKIELFSIKVKNFCSNSFFKMKYSEGDKQYLSVIDFISIATLGTKINFLNYLKDEYFQIFLGFFGSNIKNKSTKSEIISICKSIKMLRNNSFHHDVIIIKKFHIQKGEITKNITFKELLIILEDYIGSHLIEEFNTRMEGALTKSQFQKYKKMK